jgi:ABC-type uncharacterized transport system permease subunit
VTTKPSNTTGLANVKVTAILEKANAIRQVPISYSPFLFLYVLFLVTYETHSGETCQAVGSDVDDDDTWSDA